MSIDFSARKIAEAALREAKQAAEDTKAQYELVVSMISDIVWRYDVNDRGEHVGSYISPVADRMLGLPVGTIGESFEKYLSYVYPDDLPAVQKILAEWTRTFGKDKTAEYRMLKADGTTLWVLSKGSAFSQPDGRVTTVGTTSEITERKRAEEALREGEEKYRLLINNANESILVAQDSLFKFVNPATLGLLGVHSEQELIDRPFPQFIHPDDRSMVVENYRRRITNEATPPRYDFRVVTPEGIVKWVEINATLIKWQGKPATLNFLTDITERKRAEAKIASSEALLNATLDSIHDIIGIQNPDHTIVRYNHAGYEFLNLPAEEVHGRRCYELIGRNTPCEECATEKAQKTKRLEQIEKYLPEYGVFLDCRSNPVLNKDGEIEFIVEQLRDITERKRAEVALRESEARYKRIVETANEGIMIMDDQFRYAFVNQKLADMLGYQPEEMLGRPVTAFIFEEDLPDHKAKMEMRVSGRGTQYERRHRRKDGSCCWTIVSATPLKDEAGQFAGSFAMLTDITERKQAEEALIVYSEQPRGDCRRAYKTTPERCPPGSPR